MAADRWRYGAWHEGPDPLEPPYDIRAELDELGRRVLDGDSLADAMRDLLWRGHGDRPGLDQLTDRIRHRRNQLRNQGDLSGSLTRSRQLLDQALSYERDELATDQSDAARMAELELAAVPDDVARAVQALRSYQWRSGDGEQAYRQILEMLQREVLDAQFAGISQALQDPEAQRALAEMLTDLNELLAAHARGEDTGARFEQFMASHGQFFHPENPRNVDELIDVLARRSAAAERMLRSLPPKQRDELRRLVEQAMGDGALAGQMSALRENLRALRPGLDWSSPARMNGDQPLGYADGVAAVGELADLEALAEQLGQDYPGARLDDIDVEAVRRQLGTDAVRDLEALRRLERELERQGYLGSGADGLRLTPKALRRLGESALRRIFYRLSTRDQGEHAGNRPGASDEVTGATREWRFGDEQPIDAVTTVRNAILRESSSAPRLPGRVVRLRVDDFEIAETERRQGAAVALCVDLSYSMVSEGRWGPMKQTALALAHLIATRFRQDALQIIGFNLAAQRMTPVQLAEAEPDWVQGTNLQHALILAGRHLRRHPEAEPVVLIITDGEPTAHLEQDGTPSFMWPTLPETVQATIAEADRLTRYGATMNIFRLGHDPGLARFVDAVARRNGGRVFGPDPERLGEFVVADYLRIRSAPRAA